MFRVVYIVVGILLPVLVCSQTEVSRFAFYNVENLFDTIDTPGTRDGEFLPEGQRYWNSYKYYQKINKLYKAIMAVKEWENLSFLALCEVENKTVVSKFGYEIIHQESPDERGVDIALLYRTEDFDRKAQEFIPVHFPFDTTDKTRDILYTKGVLFNTDTLHIYINHWPSRYGGYMKTKPKREYAATILASHIDSVARKNPHAQIIVAGDFNDDPSDSGITTFLENTEATALIPLLTEEKGGTTKYRSQWYLFDQLFVSKNLTDREATSLQVKNASIADFSFLLQEDERYGGTKPFRTYSGPRYIGGYSDHLPVFMDIIKHKSNADE